MGPCRSRACRSLPRPLRLILFWLKFWPGGSRQTDSNRRPADYKSAALPAELCRQTEDRKLLTWAVSTTLKLRRVNEPALYLAKWRNPVFCLRVKSVAAEFHRFNDRVRPVLATCVYGLAASIAAVGFQLAINWLYGHTYEAAAAHSPRTLLWVSFVTIVSASLIVGWLLNSLAPTAAGSGIPQVKLNFWKEFGYAQKRIAPVKFIAGVICIGGGQSLGREGPTVQIGSNLASTIAGWLGVTKQNRRAASAAGAAAGLAAAFNAPLASVAFVLEEIIGDLNSRSLGPVLVAAVIGAFIVHALIGAQPAFILPHIDEPTWRAYLLMPPTALLASLSGVVFHKGALSLRRRIKNSSPGWVMPLAGGLITWCRPSPPF